MLVQHIKEVPDEIFLEAKEEIDAIDFKSIIDPRAKSEVFNTSTAIHLRVHKPPTDKPLPKTIDEWSVITECVNHSINYVKYPKVINLCKWIYEQVEGIEMGRIMIVNLAPGGIVAPHIDPLDYFEQFSRFHIPFKTNSKVVFNDGSGSSDEHMPYKTLSRLNNRLMHALYNRSAENRIHLITDIKQPNGNQIF
jgi:hypothetical protein